MTQHPLKDVTFVHCTEKPHVFPSETSIYICVWGRRGYNKGDDIKMTSKREINKKLCTVEDGFEASDNGSSNSCCMK